MENRTLMFYINSIRHGGAERVMLQLSERFAAAGWRCVLVTSFTAEDEFPVPPGVERVSLEGEQLRQNAVRRNLSRIRALRKLLLAYRPAALISFMAEPNFRAVLAARGLPVKTVISVRNDPDREYAGRVFGFVGKHILPLADGCVFQTHEAQRWFPEALREKSTVIMNQVSPAFFDGAPADERRDIVAVGRLNRQKNHALLIRAFAALGETKDRLVIYGEGPLRGELEALASELHLEGRVLLPGVSEDVARDIRAASCIATDCPCGGPAEVIENGVSGLLVPVGDEKALTAAMQTLLENEETRAALEQKARQTAERFRPEAVFRQWEDTVLTVIARKERTK